MLMSRGRSSLTRRGELTAVAFCTGRRTLPSDSVPRKMGVKRDGQVRPSKGGAMTLPSVVDVPAPDDSAGQLTGWHQFLELTRLICALAILLSAFAQDSV